jgi:hypothetical protein
MFAPSIPLSIPTVRKSPCFPKEGPLRNLFRAKRLRLAVVGLTLAAVVFHSSGCGTLLHPERQGQPHSGRIDPSIVLLDGLGLLLFFVPGVIAFAVDFGTGAIYLPPDNYGQSEHGGFAPATCEVIHVPPEELTQEKLETVLSERTGQPVKFAPGSYHVRELDKTEAKSFKVLGQSE